MSTKRQRSPSDSQQTATASKRSHNVVLLQTEDATRHRPMSLSNADYDIAWICALPVELAASRAMLDEEHEFLPAHPGDDNVYVLGRIAQHNVVMVALPLGYGKIKAANVSKDLKRSFPNVRATLMVGIGGGAPREADLYLGDVVVGIRVMEYDLGKAIHPGQFSCTATPKIPSALLRSAIVNLQAKHGLNRSSSRCQELLRTKTAEFPRPQQEDLLFKASYPHPPDARTCEDCERASLQHRQARPATDFYIHYGVIASGDSVNKDPQKRNKVSRELEALCFEMEAAGIMDNLQCLPIRGICDYSDSHKNSVWQPYAAATAAAYARELLETIPAHVERHVHPVIKGHNGVGISQNIEPERFQRRKNCLEMLDFPQINARRDAIRAEQAKTCQWFLALPKYRAWINSGKQDTSCNSLLWIRGKAGAGKSTLMKFLYSEVRKLKPPATTVVSFFFNARGEYLEKTISGMYRSLLKQVLTQIPSLQFVLDDTEISTTNGSSGPSLNVLKELFKNTIMALHRKSIICFIDALDECNENDVRDMVQFLEEITEMAKEESINFGVCFASRPYPYIPVDEEYLVELEKEAGHAEDLAKYVTKRLQVAKKTRAKLQRQILDKASGVFLWVVLVVGLLNKDSSRGGLALRKRLSEIPPSLSQLFREILKRDDERPKELQRCILWVLCAFRPLSSAEFCHAMWAAGLEDGDVDDELPDVDDEESKMALVTGSSKGLVEITNTKRTGSRVQFIHESVRDFLIKEKGMQELWPDLGFEWVGATHELLRGYCEAYLMNPTIRDFIKTSPSRVVPIRTTDDDKGMESDDADPMMHGKFGRQKQRQDEPTPKEYAFLEYASQHILEHANKASYFSIPQQSFLSRFFDELGTTALDSCRTLEYRRYGPTATPTYVLAHKGLKSLIELTLAADPSMTHDRALRFQHPLFAALAGGHEDVVALLLGLSSVMYKGESLMKGLSGRMSDLRRFSNRSPLSWACQEARFDLVEVLAHNKECLTEADPARFTPIQRLDRQRPEFGAMVRLFLSKGVDVNQDPSILVKCAAHGDLEIVQTILQKTDSVNKVYQSETALVAASGSGREEIVRLLLGRGAIVNARPGQKSTALIEASSIGHTEIVRLLLDRGATVNARARPKSTALIEASSIGHTETVRVLLDRGANIEDRDSRKRTALICASMHRWGWETAQLLLDRGADTEAIDARGRTALSYASEDGCKRTVQLLLDRGADIEARDIYGQSSLMDASKSKLCLEAARLLLDRGADIEAKDGNGQSALLHACQRMFNSSSIRLLLDWGADKEAQDVDGHNALMHASQLGCEDAVRMLLDYKASIHGVSKSGKTASQLAKQKGNSTIVTMLAKASSNR